MLSVENNSCCNNTAKNPSRSEPLLLRHCQVCHSCRRLGLVVCSRCDVGAPVALGQTVLLSLCYKLALLVSIEGSFAFSCMCLLWQLLLLGNQTWHSEQDLKKTWTRVRWKKMGMNRLLVKEKQQLFDQERIWIKTKIRSEVSDSMMLMKTQLLAVEKREEHFEKMLKKAVTATVAQPLAAVMIQHKSRLNVQCCYRPQVRPNFWRWKRSLVWRRGVSTAGCSKSRNEGECCCKIVIIKWWMKR